MASEVWPGPFVPCRTLWRYYRRYNRRYFDGRLPTDGIYVGWRFIDYQNRGRTTRGPDGKFVITLSPELWRYADFAKMTLLHEMAHVATWPGGGKGHGSAWKAEMLRLAKMGAFDRHW